jgi:hypothetical protein
MANFLLVHGAWVGGWSWREIVQALFEQFVRPEGDI